MKESKSIFRGFCWRIYFFIIMFATILMLLLMPLMFIDDANAIISSGFSSRSGSRMLMVTGVVGLFIGISLVVKTLRGMYNRLPWLFPLVKVGYLNMIILNIATLILDYGYEQSNLTRHIIFITLMIVQILVCRIIMSIYFKFRYV